MKYGIIVNGPRSWCLVSSEKKKLFTFGEMRELYLILENHYAAIPEVYCNKYHPEVVNMGIMGEENRIVWFDKKEDIPKILDQERIKWLGDRFADYL